MDESKIELIEEELYSYIMAAESTGVIPDQDGSELSGCIFQEINDSIPEIATKLSTMTDANQAQDYLEETLGEIAEQGASNALVPLDRIDIDSFIAECAEAITEIMEEEHLFTM